MKTLRKSMLLILAAIFTLAIGIFTVACGGSKVTLSFDWGDNQIVKFEATPGEETQLPADYDREGYFFMGWYDNSNFSGTKYEGTIIAPEKDTTYYARWAKGYTVNLDPGDGGTISGGMSVLVPEGGNILEYLKDHVASKTGLTFGAWFEGESEITSESVMPARELSLTAKYKADYTVQVYTQREPYSEEYVENSELSFSDKEYVGKRLSLATRIIPNYVINHGYHVGEAQTVEELVISETSSSNRFVLYCDRESYTIIYDSNAPQNVTVIGRMADQHFVYEEKASAHENAFSIEGYLFAGWSTSKSGEIKYQPGEALENSSCTLYAIWDKGYGDMFGGTDYIYFPRLTPDKVILMRGLYRMEGTFDSSSSIATFNGNLKAKILGERFAFFNEARQTSYKLYDGYEGGAGLDENTTLTLDGYYGATLSGGNSGSGTIAYDREYGCYTLTIGGRSSDILLSNVNGNDVFMYLGNEAGTYRAYQRGSLELMTGTEFEYILDGAGGVVRHSVLTNMSVSGRYKKPDTTTDLVPITMSFASEDESEFLIYSDTICIMKNSQYSGEYQNKEEGSGKLFLDGYNGMRGSTYTPADGSALRCTNYYVEQTLRGTVAHFIDENGEEYSFILNNQEKTYELTVTFNVYRMIAMVQSGQNEYLPLVLVVEEEPYTENNAPAGAKKASLYYDESILGDEEYVSEKLYDGYVIDNINSPTNPFSEFKATSELLKDEYEDYMIYKDASFKFHTYNGSTLCNVYYSFGETEITDESGQTSTEKDYLTFNEEGGSGQLVVGSLNAAENYGMEGHGSFYITSTGYVEAGVSVYYTTSQTYQLYPEEFGVKQYLVFQTLNEDYSLSSRYIALYGEGDGAKFEFLDEMPRFLKRVQETSTSIQQNSIVDGYVSLRLDGKGNAVFYQAEEDAVNKTKGVQGLYNLITTVQVGGITERIYAFTAVSNPELSFTFVINPFAEGYYSVESEEWIGGSYELENGGVLELDGFGAYAHYTDKYGNVIEGSYLYLTVDGSDHLVFFQPEQYNQSSGELYLSMIFNYDENKNLTAMTLEMQNPYWQVIDSTYNSPFDDDVVFITFDGTAFQLLSYYTGEQVGSGTYDALEEEGRYLLDVVLNEKAPEIWTVQLSLYGGNTPICMLQDNGVAGAYIDEESIVLYIDGFGEGFLVTRDGIRTEGNYRFFGNDYVIFEDENLEVYVAKYNKTERTFEILNRDESTYVTYYSPEMTAVEFGEVLRIDGALAAYWFLENGEPVYYTQDSQTGNISKADNFEYSYDKSKDKFTVGEGENQVTYTRWEKDKEFSLTGSLVFDSFNTEGNEKGEWKNVTLKFKPDGTSALNAPATLEFTHDDEETFKGEYTLRMSFVRTSSGQTLHFLNLVYDSLMLNIDMDYDDGNQESCKFVLHAAVSSDVVYIDYIHENYGGYNYGTVYAGDYYTIGLKKWAVSNWNEEISTLLYGKFNIFDNSGAYLAFEMNIEDAISENNVVGIDQNFRGEIHQILTEGGDGSVYSLDLVFMNAGSYNIYLPYAICVYDEIQDEETQETYIVEQMIVSYVNEMYGMNLPSLGVWSCRIMTGEGDEQTDLLEEYSTNIWDVNVAIGTYEGEDEEHDGPEYYVIWFDGDENNHFNEGHYKKGSGKTVSQDSYQFEVILIEGEGDQVEGFIPLAVSKRDASQEYKAVQILDWDYDAEHNEFTIIYSLDESGQDVEAVKVKIEGTKDSPTVTVTEVDLGTLQN